MTAPWWEGPLAGFDLETTGPDPLTARIVTACVVETIPYSTLNTSTWLADPGVEIPAEAAAVHGVTTEQAQAHGRPADHVVDEVLVLLAVLLASGVPLVAFNASFDFTVLDREARRYGLEPLIPDPVIDPFVLDKQVDRYRRGKRTLTAVCEHYGVQLHDAHTADADALAAVHVARAIGRGEPHPPADARALHAGQVVWRAEQSASLQEYLRKSDPAAVVDGTWPVHPVEVLA